MNVGTRFMRTFFCPARIIPNSPTGNLTFGVVFGRIMDGMVVST